MDTLFSTFSPSNLGQSGYPRTVLKSAHHEDSKTPPTCLIWWGFGWDIQGRRQGSISKGESNWREVKFNNFNNSAITLSN